ncbi:hypothetical protein M1255_09030 [Staphylococcus aureus]|uniref:hypothetical protein n=1 Tax=Staphylococcus aureus TaxID=1280 RepID=UPI002DBB3B4C|nr:hypothetical protein [Staphylococcus aureus]MEB6834751.1 hypothetical protein [Staphylococcus aureus]
MINETKYMRQQITNLIQIIDTIKYNTLMTDWNIQTHIYKFNQIVTNELNKFKGFETSYIINENQVSYYEIITLLNKRPLQQVDYGNKIQYLNFYHTELSNALFAIKFAH